MFFRAAAFWYPIWQAGLCAQRILCGAKNGPTEGAKGCFAMTHVLRCGICCAKTKVGPKSNGLWDISAATEGA